MRKISARKNRLKYPVLAFIFILLSIPLAIYALLNLDSFDTRNRASNDIDISACNIKFPFVNPSSIEVGKTIQIQVEANSPGDRIRGVSVMNRSGEVVFAKEYENETVERISELFTFSPTETGEYGLLGTLVTNSGSKPCVVEEKRSINVISSNLAPEFKTIPSSAKPGNAIKVNSSYEYTLIVEDAEKDTINYSYSFTPTSDWLKYSVLEDGREGRLTIKFTGKPDKPASYLANIFVHDGYNQHLRAQSWVINVDQDVNDTPKVVVYKPSEETTVVAGQTVKISWEGTDLNQITKYELFLSTNPANPNTWKAVNTNLSSKVGTYILDTTNLTAGTYQAIVRATDNYNPPTSGVGVSEKIIITGKTPSKPDPTKPDDGVILVDPQIINISPSKGSRLKNKKATVSATLIAGTGAQISETTIITYINDKDITKDLKVNKISNSEYTVVYSPKEDYKIGTHKVNIRFKDDNGGQAQKDWTFEIIEEASSEDDSINIFGFEVPKRTAMIVGGGILLLILAILVPWVLYLLWRGSKDDEYETVYNSTYSPLPHNSNPAEDKFVKDHRNEEITEKEKQNKDTDQFISPTPSEVTKIHEAPNETPIANATMWTPKVVEVEKLPEEKVDNSQQPDPQPSIEIPTPVIEKSGPLQPIETPETTEEFVKKAVGSQAQPVVLEESSSEDDAYASDDILKLAEDLKNTDIEVEENTPKTENTSQTPA